MKTVFILAAGSATRFNHVLKQALLYQGEPIIERTIRLVKQHSPGIKIYLVTWHDLLKNPGVTVIDTITQPPQLSDTILYTVPYWGDHNVLLLGDVIFSEDAIDKILSCGEGAHIFYKDICPNKPCSERFALSFTKSFRETMILLCMKSSKFFKGTTYEQVGGLVKLCYSTYPGYLMDYITPVNNNNPLSHVRDFMIFHVLPIWRMGPVFKFILIEDHITTDIDTEEEYEKLCWREKR